MAHLFFGLASLVTFILLVTGLFKPHLMLWWEAEQTRRKVLWVYGTALLLLLLLYWLTL